VSGDLLHVGGASGAALTRRSMLAGTCAAVGMLVAGCSRGPTEAQQAGTAEGPAADGRRPTMIVHKDPNCGCCQAWADIARRAGHPVEVVDEPNMAAVKARLGVPAELGSCHTTEIAGLVIEGHVPLEAVERALRERPQGLRGIAVPGMPAGSPGMETSDGRREPFQVIAFHVDGQTSPYAG